jgi:alpha-L-fucosidase
MKVNGQAIHGTTASPFPYTHDWGRITQKANKLYLMFLRWPKGGQFVLHGLRNKVRRACLPADPRRRIALEQTRDKTLNHHVLKLSLPRKAPDRHVSVVGLELVGRADADQMPIQQGSGAVHLQMHLATIHGPKLEPAVHVSRGGVLDRWTNPANSLSWEFKVFRPGWFHVELVSRCDKDKTVAGGHTVVVTLGGASLEGITGGDKLVTDPAARYHPEAARVLGRLRIDHPGVHRLTLGLVKVPQGDTAGPRLTCVNLVPRR